MIAGDLRGSLLKHADAVRGDGPWPVDSMEKGGVRNGG